MNIETIKAQIKHKRIGIWGYGRVGQSVAQLVSRYTECISILDSQIPVNCPFPFIQQTNHESILQFLKAHDFIIVSPGIDMRPYYALIKEKLITELDLFRAHYDKPIIGITGSVGKTTVCTLLSQLYAYMGKNYPAIGNIGIPICSALDQQSDGAIVEVSSFQLEHAHFFKPDIAVITHFCPNHLDRHNSIDEYLQAKYNVFDYHKNSSQIRLIPHLLKNHPYTNALLKNNTYFFSDQYIPGETFPYYYLHNDSVYFSADNNSIEVITLDQLPSCSFTINWLIIVAIIHAQGIQIRDIKHMQFSIPAHRMEQVFQNDTYLIINDSKSTTPDSTLAAVKQLQGHRIVLMLGGLSKGIDRRPLITQLKNKVEYIICFGKEGSELHKWSCDVGIRSCVMDTFDQAIRYFAGTFNTTKTTLLFSPAGSSFDQFMNYEERGTSFKNIVATYFS